MKHLGIDVNIKHIPPLDPGFIPLGRFYEEFEELKDKYREYPNLVFYKNVSNLEEYMKEADLAISAGGTTLYELCAVGTPTISYSFADNQLSNVKQFERDEVIDYAGDVRDTDIFENVWELYLKYREDCNLRKDKSTKMQLMVDGKGSARIAERLLHYARRLSEIGDRL